MNNFKLTFFVFFFFSFSVQAQQYFNDFLSLDSIIYLENFSNSHLSEYIKTSKSSNAVWLHAPKISNFEKDTLVLFKIDADKKTVSKEFAVIPELISRSKYYRSVFGFANDGNLVFYHFNSFLAKLAKKNEIFELSAFVTLEIPITKFFHHNQKLYIFNTNRSSELLDNWVYGWTYDLNTNKIIYSVYPEFDNIEFSYFSPKNWIDFYKGKSILSQTTKYQIFLFDSTLKQVKVFKREEIPNWVSFKPTNLFDSAKLTLQPNEYGQVDISYVLEYLNQYIRKISRIETVNFISEKHIMVMHYSPSPQKTADKPVIHSTDIWDIDSDKLIKSDLKIKEFSPSEKLSKNNFPLFYQENMIFLPEVKKLVVLRLGAKYDKYLNIKYLELNKQEDQYLLENEPIIQVLIYSINI